MDIKFSIPPREISPDTIPTPSGIIMDIMSFFHCIFIKITSCNFMREIYVLFRISFVK